MITFQRADSASGRKTGSSESSKEACMEKASFSLLTILKFFRFARRVQEKLEEGVWFDYVDPASGLMVSYNFNSLIR